MHAAATSARLLLLLIATLAPFASANAQQARLAPPNLLALFEVGAGTLQSLSLPGSPQDSLRVPVVLGGVPYTLALAPHDVRAANFQLFERTAQGLVLHPTPDCVTFRGSLVEQPNARVAATVVDGTLEGMVFLPPTGPGLNGETWVVQPVRRVDPRASASLHIVFRATDTNPLPYQCGTDTTGLSVATPVGSPDYTAVCEIAIEADRQFWQWNNNSVTQTQNDVTSVMNQVDFIYDRDCDTTFLVTSLIVTTTTVYTTNDSSALLSQFSNYWNTNNASIQRDIAHLFTGRNLTGSTIGVAYLGVICSQTNGYGLSQSDFTNNFNSRVGLTCHELGHNFGAPHCNGNSPCYIMCSGLGGCSNNVTLFSPAVAAQIDSAAHAASCMPPPATAPVLTSASTPTVTTFAPGSVTLQGSGLLTVDSYTVGGQTSTSGIVVVSDTALSVAMPQGTALGPTTITVSNPLGTSNALTVDYVVTQPPKLRATTLVPSTGGIASYDFGGTPGNQWFLVLGILPQTAPLQGFDLLANPLLLSFGTFSAPLGIENWSVPVPAGLGVLQFYFQVLEGDPSGVATGVSNLTTTILQ
ncbi:MAG: M12 family metallo-peptidase [Planctomycetota bacterium]